MGFIQFLADLSGGRVASLLDTEMQKVRDAVTETGKPGSMTFTIEVKPASKQNTFAHIVTHKLTAKLPQAPSDESMVFVDATGLYTRRDPRQPELPPFARIEGGVSTPAQNESAASG